MKEKHGVEITCVAISQVLLPHMPPNFGHSQPNSQTKGFLTLIPTTWIIMHELFPNKRNFSLTKLFIQNQITFYESLIMFYYEIFYLNYGPWCSYWVRVTYWGIRGVTLLKTPIAIT